MTNEQAMEIVKDTELSTAQWTALQWYFKQQKPKDKQINTELSPRLAIYEIVKAVELGDITRYQANEYIIDVLINIPLIQETKEN